MRSTNLMLSLLLLLSVSALGQATLLVIKDYKEYRKLVKEQPNKSMMELKQVIPLVQYDLRYATTANFMNRRMYPKGTDITFLRKPAALALLKVQQHLNQMGLGIKVFDAYRPFSVSEKFWELLPDDRYVANPKNGSNHNRGTAVDLTIIQLKTGEALDMGTGFDNFTDSAHHSFKNLPEQVLQNRRLLKTAMEQNGFKALETEWWHYTFMDSTQYDVMDIPFKKLIRRL